jgi:hypothetical protein
VIVLTNTLLQYKSGKNEKPRFARLFCLLLFITLAGCGRHWEAVIVDPDGSDFIVDPPLLESLSAFADEDKGVPLERVLWSAGYFVIERLVLIDEDGTRHVVDWTIGAENAWWRENGVVDIQDQAYRVSRVEVEVPELMDQAQAKITDIAPTAAKVLGLPAPEQSNGSILFETRMKHVLLLFLDGFGYIRYNEALEAGLIPNLAALPAPLLALTEYPPSTRVGTAALLTGAPSDVNGVDGRSVRNTDLETLFDLAFSAGLRVFAVEGDALAFNLRGAEVRLSGDRDGNSSTDDNVLANALSVLRGGMPELFFVHFHGIDDAGHSFGPGSLEEETTIHEVDAAVGQLLGAIPAQTCVIIFADHGMHLVEEEGRLGNHGHLIERDMFIPIFITTK